MKSWLLLIALLCGSFALCAQTNPAPPPSGSRSIFTNYEYSNGVCATAATINAINGNRQSVTLTAGDACTLSFVQPNFPLGTVGITIRVTQSSTSPYNGTITGGIWLNGTPTIPTTSGTFAFVYCYLDGINAYCFPYPSVGGSGGGTVTSFAAPSASWPSWLVPTVTNSTTTPSLAVAVSTVPLASGGTGAITATAALSNLLANPAAANYLVDCTTTSSCTYNVASFANLSGNLGTAQGPSSLTGVLYDTAGTLTAKPLAGSGAAIPTGPTSTTSGDCAQFTGTTGQLADSGAACGSSSGNMNDGSGSSTAGYFPETTTTAHTYSLNLPSAVLSQIGAAAANTNQTDESSSFSPTCSQPSYYVTASVTATLPSSTSTGCVMSFQVKSGYTLTISSGTVTYTGPTTILGPASFAILTDGTNWNTAWGNASTLAGLAVTGGGTAVTTGPTSTTTNDCVKFSNTTGQITDAGSGCGGSGGTGRIIQSNAIGGSNLALTGTANSCAMSFVNVATSTTVTTMAVYVGAADATGTDYYNVGLAGPLATSGSCSPGNSCTVVAQWAANTSLTVAGNKFVPLASSATLSPGTYLVLQTGNAITAQLQGNSAYYPYLPYSSSTIASCSSGGVINSSVTLPSSGTSQQGTPPAQFELF